MDAARSLSHTHAHSRAHIRSRARTAPPSPALSGQGTDPGGRERGGRSLAPGARNSANSGRGSPSLARRAGAGGYRVRPGRTVSPRARRAGAEQVLGLRAAGRRAGQGELGPLCDTETPKPASPRDLTAPVRPRVFVLPWSRGDWWSPLPAGLSPANSVSGFRLLESRSALMGFDSLCPLCHLSRNRSPELGWAGWVPLGLSSSRTSFSPHPASPRPRWFLGSVLKVDVWSRWV